MVRLVSLGSRSLLLSLLLAGGLVAQAATAGVTEHVDLQYAEGHARDGRRNALDLYVPVAVDRPPLVMFVHGGGWSAGNKERYGALGHALGTHGIACATINTRMHPFVRPADMVEDCARAFGFLHDRAAEYGYDAQCMFLMGHSAGAHLVSWLALDDAQWALAEMPRAALRGVIALSGVYDARPSHVLLDKVFGADHDARAAASPSLHMHAHPPPFSVVWAERDIPGLALGSRMFVHRLRRCGCAVETVELAGRNHVDYVRETRRPGAKIVQHAVDYVRRLAAQRPSAGVLASPAAVLVTRPLAGEAPLPIELFAPRGPASQWLVLAIEPAERAAAAALARHVAGLGGAVAIVDCGADDGLGDARRVAAFSDTIRRLADPASGCGLPNAPPFLGAIGAAGWLVGCSPVMAAGKLLLGAPAAAAVTRGVLRGERRHGENPDRLLRRSSAPILLVFSAGDPQTERIDCQELARIVNRKGDAAIDLPADAIATRLRNVDAEDDTLLPLVAAFLGL